MGLRLGRDPGHSSTAVSDRAHAFGRRRNAVSNQKIPCRSHRGKRHTLRHPRIPWGALWPWHPEVFWRVLLAGAYYSGRFIGHNRAVRSVRVQAATKRRGAKGIVANAANSSTDGVVEFQLIA